MRLRAFSRAALLGCFLCFFGFGAGRALAFSQPPVNLSATTFLDGGAPPGSYYLNYTILTQGRTARDNDGKVIPGDARVNVLVQLHQFYYLSQVKVLGGNLGVQVLVPVAAPSSRGGFGPVPLKSNTAGLGDLVVGPAIQWDRGTFLGRPIFQRAETDLTFPTGKYDKAMSINPGSNLFTVDSYYSAVWLFSRGWETSFRLWYAFQGENNDAALGNVKPGQLFHVNFAVSREIIPKLRLGTAGYFLTQTTEDQVNGAKSTNSKERAAAVGPGLVYLGPGFTAMLSHPVEFGVRNRFQGSRTTLQLVHRF